MPDITAALADNRAAVDDLIAAAEKSESVWTTPRAPRKWSPSQVVEHVALSLEESANVAAGVPSKFPSLPRLIRPVVRLVFRWILRRQSFPKGKTPKPFDPAAGSATPAEARVRLEEAATKFDQKCRTCAAGGGAVASTVFGTISVDDYVRFQALHVRHHMKQLPPA
ncbi:MAG: DUF1569 domain-containing protein [Gemmatimonadetes bacterium]|nr:DUF1569 domain-containing protein [Gemmatimonadota bacterium]